MKYLLIILFSIISIQFVSANNSFSNSLNNEIYVAKDSFEFSNQYVQVVRDSAVCTNANTSNIGSRIIVALDKIKFKSSKGVHKLKRGQLVVFLENESYDLPKGKYFEVALKKDHPPLLKPEQWVEPKKNTIVYEDAEFRIFEERLEAGDTRELHSHAQRLVVRLNQVQLTDPRYALGKPGTGIQVANTVKFAEPVVHVVKNLSDIPLFNIVIEFKIAQ